MFLRFRALLASFLLAASVPTFAATAVHIEAGAPGFLSFDVAEQPKPAAFVLGSSFTLDRVRGLFNGVAGTRTIDFFANNLGGGFQIVGGPGITSQPIYSGGENRPFIASGDYFAQDRATGANVGLLIFESGTVGGVPEPAVWALLIGGFGLIGATLRRRRPISLAA